MSWSSFFLEIKNYFSDTLFGYEKRVHNTSSTGLIGLIGILMIFAAMMGNKEQSFGPILRASLYESRSPISQIEYTTSNYKTLTIDGIEYILTKKDQKFIY